MQLLNGPAYRWTTKENMRKLVPVEFSSDLDKTVLIGLDEHTKLINANIEFLLEGRPALNMLLWGENGSGKSTIIRMLARDYSKKGLRIIEFCDDDFRSIYDLYLTVRLNMNSSFILYFDDISFDKGDERYRNFKSVVEGGLEEKPKNAIIVATSNRRHLVNERSADTGETYDIYQRDQNNEMSSLFARFGLTLGFYPLSQNNYLSIVEHYMASSGIPLSNDWQKDAAAFAIDRGGFSGRAAKQYSTYTQVVVRAHKTT